MAKSTCNPNRKAPKGMKKFEVIRSTIKDSVGQYCEPGDMAILDKEAAAGYLKGNFIRIALAEIDFDESTDSKENDASDDSEATGADDSGQAEDAPSPRPRQVRTRASADS